MALREVFRELNENGERWLLLPLYALIVTTVFVEVLRRFLLSYSSIWGEEIARYAFIYVAWIAASACVRDRTHIKLDILLHFAKGRFKAFLYVLNDVMMLAMAVISLYWSVEPVMVSLEFGSVTDGLRISKAWFLFAVPLGFSMLSLRTLQALAEDWKALVTNEPLKEARQIFD